MQDQEDVKEYSTQQVNDNNRNQHFETTFEGFNKNKKKTSDQNQRVSE